jgi:cobalt-zinc-cadmium efflux system membrane fusion protein
MMKPTSSRMAMRLLFLFAVFTLPLRAAEPPTPPPTVNANAALLAKLKVVVVGQTELRDSLRVPARVELDRRRLAHIGASVAGRVVEIKRSLGDDVKKGDLLAVLNSSELGTAQSEYLKAISKLKLRQSAFNRAKQLYESGIIAVANLQQRQNELSEAEVDLDSSRDHLKVMGMSEPDITDLGARGTIKSLSPITATLTGTVIERNITLGQVVQPSDAVFTVSDLSHVWLVAEVSERNAQWAREGDEAEAEISALPGKRFIGRLIYIGDVIDPDTRTMTVRMDLPNPSDIIKPNMLATLLIRKQGTQEAVIPLEAVVREGDRDHVFVQVGKDQFALRPVELGDPEGSVRPIISGLELGERIVSTGSFHLNNERMRAQLEE